MKKILVLCITIVMLCSISLASEIGITFNGEKLISDVAPVKINNRVMVPVRVISEKAGATVDFNYQTNEITLTNSNAVVKLTVNSELAYINGKEKILDVPATEINNRTLVPIRFVGESLGLNVDWVDETVVITTKNDVIITDENEDESDKRIEQISKLVLDMYLQAIQNDDIENLMKDYSKTKEEIVANNNVLYGTSLEKIKSNVKKSGYDVSDDYVLDCVLILVSQTTAFDFWTRDLDIDIQEYMEISDRVSKNDISNTVKNGKVPTLKASQLLNGNERFITNVTFVDNYISNGTEPYWIIDENGEGTIKCYAVGTELIISGNGTGKIMANKDSSEMFREFKWLKEINGLEILDMSKVSNMVGMFYDCGSLEKLDVSNWDTNNVTNMAGMFYGCKSLERLDVSNWNTSSVTSMRQLFFSCYELQEIDVSKWDVSNVMDMHAMFLNCNLLLDTLDISNWNINKDADTEFMFDNYLM